MNERVLLKSLGAELELRLPGMIDAAVAKAMPKREPAVEIPFDRAPGSLLRDRKFTLKDDQKGIAAARFVRALAFGKGSTERAKYFVQKVFNDELGDEIQRALTVAVPAAAGNLIPPEYAAEIIELLRSRTVVRAAGARSLPMDSGALTIRRHATGSTANYVGESTDIPVTQPTVGVINLVSRKLAAIVPISNDLLAFTSGPSADQFVRDDLVMEMCIREDRAFLRDDGTSNTPRGMRYWAAVANVIDSTGTTAAAIETDLKNLMNALEGADVRMIRPAWFMHPSRKNHLRNLRDTAGNLIYPEMRGASPMLYSYPVFVTTSIPSNLGSGGDNSEVYLADMVDALIGEATSLEIVVDSSASYEESGTLKSAFSRDETLIRSIARHDFAMRHDESVAVLYDVDWGK